MLIKIFTVWVVLSEISALQTSTIQTDSCLIHLKNGKELFIENKLCDDVAQEINKK